MLLESRHTHTAALILQEKYTELSAEHGKTMDDLQGFKEKLRLALEEASELDARVTALSEDKEAGAAALAELTQEHSGLMQQKHDAQNTITQLEEQVKQQPISSCPLALYIGSDCNISIRQIYADLPSNRADVIFVVPSMLLTASCSGFCCRHWHPQADCCWSLQYCSSPLVMCTIVLPASCRYSLFYSSQAFFLLMKGSDLCPSVR